MLEPNLSILPPAQQELWPLLADVPKTFVLYGGTALALRLGHRQSVDFDFFASEPCDFDQLLELPFAKDCTVARLEPSTMSLWANMASGQVKVELFSNLSFGRVGTPDETSDGNLLVASALDVFGTKFKTLLQRVASKDYLDIAALLKAGVPLNDGLGAAMAMYGNSFPPADAVRSLGWFGNGDLQDLDEVTRQYLTEQVSAWDLKAQPLPKMSSTLH